MKVGKYLLEKHNFGDEEVKSRFLDQFGYSERILEAILDDRYQALLTCHLHDLAIFTGEDIDFLDSLQEFDTLTEFEKQTLNSVPLGKQYVPTHPVFATFPVKTEVVVKDPTTGEWDKEKGPIPVIKLNLNSDDPVELNEIYPDPELEALLARARELSKGKTFRIITPKALEVGDPIPPTASEADYVITTYPITGPQSVKIVKGRELGIGDGDKFVVANQMRSTINKLGLGNPPPEEVEVMLGNKRIAALMEDPEFRKEWQDVVAERLVDLAKRKLGEGFELELPPRQTGCRGKDLLGLYYKDNDQSRSDYKLDDVVDQELVSVPKGLLRKLANIAIDNGYPCAEEAFQYLTKNK